MADNKIKIQNVLSEQFDKHRYIFWYDEDGTMEELVTGMDIEGVETLTLDHNAFSLKYRIQTGEQPEREDRAEGEQSKAMDIAKNLKSMGFSIADIMKATGLSEDDIMKL